MPLPRACGALTQGLLLGLLIGAAVVVLLLGGDAAGLQFRYVGF